MTLHLTLDGEKHSIEIVQRRPRLRLKVDDCEYEIANETSGATGCLHIDDARVDFARAIAHEAREVCFVRIDGRTHEVELIDAREESAGRDVTRDEIHAPMPGAVVSVHKAPGDSVARGDTVVTIESMKLQTALTAPRDGVILDVLKETGEKFDKDELIARLAPAVED